jgi:uncharacterized protein (DUF427 family)
MSLTVGSGPFGQRPAGSFSFEVPSDEVAYLEASPRWIRGRLGGQTVVNSKRVRMLHESGRLPVWLFPEEDVRLDLLPESAVERRHGLIEVDFRALDEWLEEDERQIGHPRDPYHRIDIRRTSRHVRVSIAGEPVADTTSALVLFETGLPPRWYIPREDLRAELTPSELTTVCAYKGRASHWSVAGEEAVAWSYEEPFHEVLPVRGFVAFYDERVDLELDGELRERPRTQWSRD